MKLRNVFMLFIMLLSSIGFIAYYQVQQNKTIEIKPHLNQINLDAQKITSSKENTTIKQNVVKEPDWLTKTINAIELQASNLNKEVLKTSLKAYQQAKKQGVTDNPLLTIVDYSKPSAEKRLWVIDLDKQKVLFNTWVAHGKNSGNINSTSFSNKPQSLKSSLGVFLTGDIYTGKHGNSLHVRGLEPGINDNAYDRSIVFHGAQYVTSSIAKSGRIGRSWGCWAVSPDIISSLIKTIKNNSLVVAYYPDTNWLSKSSFLN